MRHRKPLALLAIAVVGLVVLLAASFYLRPLFFITEAIHFRLFRDGAASRYAQVNLHAHHYQLHYYAAGSGPPVVLIHGIGSSGENWTGVLPALLQTGHRVYLPDLLGFGRSERPDVDYSMAFQADVLDAFLDTEHIPSAVVGGVSMGGWVALQLAASHPDKVSGLVLIDSAGTTFAPTFQPSLFEPRTVPQLENLINFLMPRPVHLPDYLGRDILRSFAPNGWVIHRAMDSMFTRRDLVDERLANLTMPTLIIWGKEDRLIPPATGEFLHSRISNSQLDLLEGCGHLVLEACADRVAPRIAAFLRAHKPPY